MIQNITSFKLVNMRKASKLPTREIHAGCFLLYQKLQESPRLATGFDILFVIIYHSLSSTGNTQVYATQSADVRMLFYAVFHFIIKPPHELVVSTVFLKHWPDSYKFNTNPRGVCVIIDCVGNDGGETFSSCILVKLCLVKATCPFFFDKFRITDYC